MKAIHFVEPEKIKVVDIPMPEMKDDEVIAKVSWASICGTDLDLLTGNMIHIKTGMTKYPIIPGHEWSGTIVKVGPAVKNFKVGDRVLGGMVFDFGVPGLVGGWGGFSEYVLVNDHDAMERDGIADASHGWYDSCIIQKNFFSFCKHFETFVDICFFRCISN